MIVHVHLISHLTALYRYDKCSFLNFERVKLIYLKVPFKKFPTQFNLLGVIKLIWKSVMVPIKHGSSNYINIAERLSPFLNFLVQSFPYACNRGI